MNLQSFGNVMLAAFVAVGLSTPSGLAEGPATKRALPSSSSVERHFKNVRQLTFGRQNAEA